MAILMDKFSYILCRSIDSRAIKYRNIWK